MSKRSLVIIIALLLLVDLAAALWYMTLRIEASGKSSDLFNINSNDVAVEADTITDNTLPDTFQRITQQVNMLSEQPAPSVNASAHYATIKKVDVRWPQSINGTRRIAALEHALLSKMFDGEYETLNGALSTYMRTANFGSGVDVAYRVVNQEPAITHPFGHRYTLLAYPLMTSFRFLVMEVDRYTYDGRQNSTTKHFVHYDRINQRVLARNDILSGDETVLLALINDKIDNLNARKNTHLEHTSRVANEFSARRTGIIFQYQPGEIAPANEGPTEILIEYTKLGPCLTSDFKAMLRTNGGYWNYSPLSEHPKDKSEQ